MLRKTIGKEENIMADKKNKKSLAYKIFVENIEIKIIAIVLALFVTIIINIK